MAEQPRVALVHDYFVHVRGAERFLLVLADLFPQADIYLLVMERPLFPREWRGRKVWTSFLSRLPNPERWFRYPFPLYPYIVERLDFSDYDRVDDFELNEILWHAIKGERAPMPEPVRRAIANRPMTEVK